MLDDSRLDAKARLKRTRRLYAADPDRLEWLETVERLRAHTGVDWAALRWIDDDEPARVYVESGVPPASPADTDSIAETFLGSNEWGYWRLASFEGPLTVDRPLPELPFPREFDPFHSLEGFSDDSDPTEKERTQARRLVLELVHWALDMGSQDLSALSEDATLRIERIPGDEADGEYSCCLRILRAFMEGGAAGVGAALNDWGEHLERQGFLQMASDLYWKAYTLGADLLDATVVCDALRFEGRVLRKLGSFDDALECYGWAQSIAEEIGDMLRLGRIRDGSANVHRDAGRWNVALAIWEELAESEIDEVAAAALHNLMEAHRQIGELLVAASFGWRCLAKYDDVEKRGWAVLDLGAVLLDLGELDAAEYACHITLSTVASVEYRAMAHFNLGRIQATRGDGAGAAREWELATTTSLSVQVEAIGLIEIAIGLHHLGDHVGVSETLNRVENLARNHGLSKVSVDLDALRQDLVRPVPESTDEFNDTIEEIRGGLRRMASVP